MFSDFRKYVFFYISIISDFFHKNKLFIPFMVTLYKKYVNIVTKVTHLHFSINFSSVVTMFYRAFKIDGALNVRIFVVLRLL